MTQLYSGNETEYPAAVQVPIVGGQATSTVLMACTLASAPLVAAESKLIAHGAELEVVRDDFQFIEGPVSDAEGTFYLTNIDADKIYKMSFDGEFSVFREKSQHSKLTLRKTWGKWLRLLGSNANRVAPTR